MSLPNELLYQILESLFLDAQTSVPARQALCHCLSVSNNVRLMARRFVFKNVTIELHVEQIVQPDRTHALWEVLSSDPTVLEHITSLSIEMIVGLGVLKSVDAPIFCTVLRLLQNASFQSFTIRCNDGAQYRIKDLHPTIIDSLVSIRGNTSLRELRFIRALDAPQKLIFGIKKEDTVQKLCLPNLYPDRALDATFDPISRAFPPLPSLIDLEVLHICHFLAAAFGPTTTEAIRNCNIRLKRLRLLYFIKEGGFTSQKQWEMIKLTGQSSLEILSVVTSWREITSGMSSLVRCLD